MSEFLVKGGRELFFDFFLSVSVLSGDVIVMVGIYFIVNLYFFIINFS